MPFETVQQELLRATLTLAAGFLVARIGLAYYFRQKEYETVKQRYLEQSVDLIASDLESISWAFSHNWARSLEILRLYRELPGTDFNPQELETGFVELRATNFQQVAHHRLTSLLRTNAVWEAHQLALSGYKTLNGKVTREFIQGVRLHHAGRLTLTHEQFIKESEDLLKPLSDQSDRYAHLLLALEVVASELEKSALRFKELEKFHKRDNIKAALQRLSNEFSQEFQEAIA